MSYVRDQKKITIYYNGHDYYDVPVLCLKAADSLIKSGYDDCVYQYGETITVYAKQNKAGITVRQLI